MGGRTYGLEAVWPAVLAAVPDESSGSLAAVQPAVRHIPAAGGAATAGAQALPALQVPGLSWGAAAAAVVAAAVVAAVAAAVAVAAVAAAAASCAAAVPILAALSVTDASRSWRWG